MICCYYTSYLFLIIGLISILYKYYIHSLLFLFLFTTSILFYTQGTTFYFIIDQIAIVLCVLYGLYLYYHKFKLSYLSVIVFYSFIFSILLFYGGYYLNEFCYCETYGNIWHSIIHILCVIAHTLIIFL
jgi:hypothetical protein